MGFRAKCKRCGWVGEFYLTERTAEMEGLRHKEDEHDDDNDEDIEIEEKSL